jgi:hypothetical protein
MEYNLSACYAWNYPAYCAKKQPCWRILKMTDAMDRTLLLMGEEAVSRLRNAHVLVLGVGGVGGEGKDRHE